MSFRVCIPTAGTGSRLGAATAFLNKSLVGIANKPAICRIIDLFPGDAEFVIALGHKGDLVRDFLELVYPSRTFFFAEVAPFEGPGSGLGLSILECSRFLQQPFVFVSCDTLVEGPVPGPDENWMGFAKTSHLDAYRCVRLAEGRVVSLLEKGLGVAGEDFAYIGLAGIHDYEKFWSAMEAGAGAAVQQGESFGLRGLISEGVKGVAFDWFDTGTPEALAQTRDHFKKGDEPHILEKENEAIWFVGGKVIKFSDDASFIENRVKRALLLEAYVPRVENSRRRFYLYSKAEGEVLSNVVNAGIFKDLLRHTKGFWRSEPLEGEKMAAFQRNCMVFYRDKTRDRISAFYSRFNVRDNALPINGGAKDTMESLLARVPWDDLARGLPGRFHGDFHFENILWSRETGAFLFLDWRQDFAGVLEYGDIYYDFAKLLHGIIVSHEVIDRNLFSVEWTEAGISYELMRKSRHVECETLFKDWLQVEGYDCRKVEILTAIVFLNIAALHHHPYSLLLYALGKDLLQKAL